jgi:hypothetical protein
MDPDDYMAVGSRGIGVVRENKNDYNDALGIAMMREQSPEGFELDEEHPPTSPVSIVKQSLSCNSFWFTGFNTGSNVRNQGRNSFLQRRAPERVFYATAEASHLVGISSVAIKQH